MMRPAVVFRVGSFSVCGSGFVVPLLGLAVLSALFGAVQTSAAASRLAVIKKAADFSLTTQAGAALRLGDLKGKVLLVSFVFTTCNGTCPATTHRMGQVQQELKTRGLFKGDRV